MQSKEPINSLQVALLSGDGVVRHAHYSKVSPINLLIEPSKRRFRICRNLVDHLRGSNQAGMIASRGSQTRRPVISTKPFQPEQFGHITKKQTQSTSPLPVGTFRVFKLLNYLKATFSNPLKSRMIITNLKNHKKYLPVAAILQNTYRTNGGVIQYPCRLGKSLPVPAW